MRKIRIYNIHLEKLIKYAVAFAIGMILGYIFVSYSMPKMGNKISLALSYGYIVLSGYVGIPLVYNIILKVKDFILNAFSVFTFGLWFFIPISYSFILIIWIFTLSIGLALGMFISIPMIIYNFVQLLRKK